MAYVFEDESRYVFEDESRYVFEEPKKIVAPKKPVGHYEGWIKPTLQDIGEGITATPRTIGSIATGMLAWPIGKTLGVGTLMEGGTVEEARKAEERVASYAIQPKGKAGTQATELIGKAIETGLIPAKMAGEQATKNWGEKAGYLTELAGELAMFWMVGKGAKKAGVYTKEKKVSKELLDKKLSKLTPEERAYVNDVAKGHVLKDIPKEAPKLDKTFAAHEEGVKFTEGIKKRAEKVSERKALPEGKPQLPVKRGSVIELPHDKGRYVFEETKEVAIPKFKTTGEAFKFGKKATKAEFKELQRLKQGIRAESSALLKQGKAKEAGDMAQKSIFYTEAIQARQGRDFTPKKPVKAIEPEKQPAAPSEIEKGKVVRTRIITERDYRDPHSLVEKRINKKYAEILERKEEPRGQIYEDIDYRTLTPKDLKRHIVAMAEKDRPAEINNLKSVIADNVGELIETHKYEGRKEGMAVENYIDSLLDVLSKEYLKPPKKQPTTPIKAEKPAGKALTKKPQKESILKSQKGEIEIDVKAIKEGIKKVVEDLEESPTYKGLKESVKVTARGLKEGVRSPEDVYKPDPVGRKIYRRIDRADQKANAFSAVEGEKFAQAVKGIKAESHASRRIGMALDGKIARSELTAKHKKAYDFFKKQYHYLIQKYARTAAGTEEGYLKVLRAANKERPIQVKVSDLPPALQKKYSSLKNKLTKIRKGRALKDLGADKKAYWDVRREMNLTLNKGWTEKLTAGERQAYDVLSSRIKDYLPHQFERTELLAGFKNEISIIKGKLKTATNKGAITRHKNDLRKLEDSVIRLEKGYMVTYESLPQNIRFKFFESRKGKAGYSFDAIKAYQAYLSGITKKIYIEPAIKEVAQLHKELSPDLKSYNKWYIRRYMGWDRSPLDTLSGAIVSAQWMRTLGANPRSALVNLTQRLNTIVEVGERQTLGRPILSALHLKKGELLGYTKKGTKLFDDTGIAKEVPQVLVEGNIPAGMEGLRSVLGYMFSKVEIGNRKHAFLSGYSLAKSGKMSPRMAKRYAIENPKKMTETECVQFGLDVVHKTQFRYSKVGMPKILTHPVGRVAFQFWSYPIKQTEFMLDLLKGNPKKLIKLLAYAEGSKYALDEFLNIDLSNALGVGVTWSEALKAVQAVPEGDWRKFFRHALLTFSGGGGVLPSGLGPTATGVSKVAYGMTKGRGFQALKKELTPVQLKRFSQAYTALKNRKGKRYPVYNRRKHLMYYVTSKELVMRTIGPRPARESKQYIEWKKSRALEQERREVLQDIIDAIIDGNSKKVNTLTNRYSIMPTDEAIDAEMMKRVLTNKERKSMKEPKKVEEYQYQQEGRIY